MIRCKKCGQIIGNDSFKFCYSCGEPLTAAAKQQKKRARKHYRPRGTGAIRVDRRNGNAPYVANLPQKYGGSYVGSYKTYEEASEALLTALSSTPTSDRTNWTVQQFYDAFLLSDAFVNQSRNGQNSMRAAWKYCADVADYKMRDVMGTRWQSCIDKAAEQGKSRSTCEKIRVLISALCKEAMRDNIIHQNYAKLLTVKGTLLYNELVKES